ncbi:MAG TPA: hydantoinase/oxoprolinase family protein [Rhizobiaceae bacterium]|nr:hydantoinase/oxoprolinase family protein [Rhizobiaceae bacterium]
MYSIGVDIGGTFTDFTVIDGEGGIWTEKVLSTPSRPEEAIMTGLTALENALPGLMAHCGRISHAATLVTNAIIERKGAKVALLATEGFRDVLQMGMESRYNVYDLFLKYPEPLVGRDLRLGVKERVYSDGAVIEAIDEESLGRAVETAKQNGIESVAVCFLHAYRNPDHEKRAEEIVLARLPGVSVSCSYDVSPEPREYERTSTTVLNAYVKPVVERYLTNLESELAERGCGGRLEIMLSNGTSTSAEIAKRFPIQMIESGPAAGVEAAIAIARQMGLDAALSFDMGGTTAKLCVVQGGTADRARKFEAARVHRFVAGSGFPVSVPVYDLVEIGAGGGSIAGIDQLGLISVGPESAGASPGPACYGRGGTHPTVTDANLVLGYLDADAFLGGDMKLDTAAAVGALRDEVGRHLDMDEIAAASGIVEIVNETMAAAARIHVAEKGCDASKLSMVAFGGAGPLHAIELARKLGCPRVVFPPHAGVMSSLGLLSAVPSFERVASVNKSVGMVNGAFLADLLEDLRRDAARFVAGAAELSFFYVAEMRFRGQDHTIDVPLELAMLDRDVADVLSAAFRDRYRSLYNRTTVNVEIELTKLRCVAVDHAFAGQVLFRLGNERQPPGAKSRQAYDPVARSKRDYPVLARASLSLGDRMEGPVIVQERETCFVLHKGDVLSVHESGSIVVEIGRRLQ